MAEWVQKGNLKGPQGDPGQDAQLPAGGTEGQVLTKTSGGEAWADAPEPDLTGVVKVDQYSYLSSGDKRLSAITVGTNTGIGDGQTDYVAVSKGNITMLQSAPDSGSASFNAIASHGSVTAAFSGNQSASMVVGSENDHGITLYANPEATMFGFDTKQVTSITDDASTGDTKALATAKAVKDYVDAHGMPSVVPISQGGTGATTAEGARTALGIPDIEVATDEEFDSYMGLS